MSALNQHADEIADGGIAIPNRDLKINRTKYDCNSPKFKFEVVENPKIQGGLPTIKGTRWPVYELAAMAEVDGIDETLASFDSLNRDMIENAILYAKENPRV